MLFYGERPANGYFQYFYYKTFFTCKFHLCWNELNLTGSASLVSQLPMMKTKDNFRKMLFNNERPASGYFQYFYYKTVFACKFHMCWNDLNLTGLASLISQLPMWRFWQPWTVWKTKDNFRKMVFNNERTANCYFQYFY